MNKLRRQLTAAIPVGIIRAHCSESVHSNPTENETPEVALRWITQSGASFTVASQSAAHFGEDLDLFGWQES